MNGEGEDEASAQFTIFNNTTLRSACEAEACPAAAQQRRVYGLIIIISFVFEGRDASAAPPEWAPIHGVLNRTGILTCKRRVELEVGRLGASQADLAKTAVLSASFAWP